MLKNLGCNNIVWKNNLYSDLTIKNLLVLINNFNYSKYGNKKVLPKNFHWIPLEILANMPISREITFLAVTYSTNCQVQNLLLLLFV